MVMLGDTTCKRHKALTKRLPEAIVGKIVTMAEEIVHWSKYRYVMYQLICHREPLDCMYTGYGQVVGWDDVVGDVHNGDFKMCEPWQLVEQGWLYDQPRRGDICKWFKHPFGCRD